ncbi:hypothetical protein NX862_07065 [Rhodobacter sp. KR11]|jgi:hypothetical protein|nr:hypothetical protein [Rhodobacter sp. KR11]MCW1918507.1 hypothetical protein [Rhodobacter sp. KR11]
MSKLQSAPRPEVPGLSYYTPQPTKPAPQPPLTALEQMFGYYG